jgi:hypothetical protein
MTKSTGSDEEKMTTPSQNGQGHSDTSLVPTEVLAVPCNEHVEDPMQEPNQEGKKKKKKKSRGNRKAQHKRRRLRRQLRNGNANQNAMEPDVVGLHKDEQQIEVG